MRHVIRAAGALAAAGVVATLAAGALAAGQPPLNTSAPTIEGPPIVGKTLGAGNGSWLQGATSFTYQWDRCDAKGNGCVNIPGATDRSYTVADADLGHTIVVLVTASNANGKTGPVNSKPSDVVTPPEAPKLSKAPTIVGKARVGEQLVANPGEYAGGAVTKTTFQWQRCSTSGADCVDVAGATSQTYGVLTADVDHTLRVQVKATNEYGTTLTTSDRTATVGAATAPPPPRVTTTLVASRGTTICCQTVHLSGTIAPAKAGQAITILATEQGEPVTYPVAQATTDASGGWSAVVTPMVQTTYVAQTSSRKSTPLTVRVHPRVGLGVTGNTFTTKVTARDSFGGRVVLFQTRTKSTAWHNARAVVLDLHSSAKFTVRLKKGVTFYVRAYLSDVQAGAGYLDGTSHTRTAGGQG
jgi:hypothetical protein